MERDRWGILCGQYMECMGGEVHRKMELPQEVAEQVDKKVEVAHR